MGRNTPYIKAIEKNVKQEVEAPEKYDGDISRIISTGSTLLDLEIMGKRVRGGGLPGGILVEVYGPNSGGKTVLMSEIAGGIQRQKGKVKFFDAEARLSKKFAEIFDFKVVDCEFGVPNQVGDVFLPLMTWNPDGPPCIGEYSRRKKKCRECEDESCCADFDLDDLAFLFRQVRIRFSHRCCILGLVYGQLPIWRVLHFHLDNGYTNNCSSPC